MLDRLSSMNVFVKAADLGSFTAAAAALGMTSQMVGKHIAALEGDIGATLLQRTTRRQKLTETGRLFYDRCRAVLAEADAAYAVREASSAELQGLLRVSAPVGFGACRLAPILSDFIARHSGVEVELALTDRVVDVIDEGYDAVLRLGPIAETSLTVRELTVHDQICCASPGYLERHGTPQTPADLGDHDCLAYVNWSGRPYAEWRFGKDGIVSPLQIRSRFRVNDGRVLVDAAIAGHGVILQPRVVVEQAVARGELVPILTDYTAPARELYLIHSSRGPRPARLRALVDHLVHALA
jgi:DNA-binding transcriptional LysR family regulator